jgi:hypothetical protein
MKLPEPFCHFCRHKDGDTWTIDYDELHAIACGIGFPILLWPFLLHYGGYVASLLTKEPHYVALGMLIRFGGLMWVATTL